MTWTESVRSCELYCTEIATPRNLEEAKKLSMAIRSIMTPQIPQDYWSAEQVYEFGLER